MAGHSKWKNIMHKKGKTDAQRAKLFTKVGREITAIVKAGGPDPVVNTRLRDAIVRAKQNNVPNDNIERIIKKASGDSGGAEYLEMLYEGYGPQGIAVIVETLSDNRNRTAADMRHYFDKYGGNLGTSGSVAWQFERRGVLLLEVAATAGEQMEEDIIDAGAEDYSTEEGICEVLTEPTRFDAVRQALSDKGYSFLSAEISRLPSTYVDLSDEGDIKNMLRLLDMLEDNDDVQQVFHNWGNPPQEDE